MKRILLTIAVLVPLGALGAFLFAWSGLYNVSASSGHWPVSTWFLHFGLRNSVETQSMLIDVPDLSHPAQAMLGLGHYQYACAPCHGSPAVAPNAIAQQMLPVPPYLPDKVGEWEDEELFWIVKHGLKYSGMPAWPTQQRDDEVWGVVAFLRRMPSMGPEEYRRLSGLDALPDQGPEGDRAGSSGLLENRPVACARCHGPRGAGGGEGAFPRLAGQSADYLAAALDAYALGARPSGVMQPIAAELTPEARRRAADYYAAQAGAPPLPRPPVPADLLAEGEAIALRGAPAQGVPACQGCHGATRPPATPALEGQWPRYIEQQLRLWKAGNRGGTPSSEVMGQVALRLDDRQIEAVAAWYGARPVP